MEKILIFYRQFPLFGGFEKKKEKKKKKLISLNHMPPLKNPQIIK